MEMEQKKNQMGSKPPDASVNEWLVLMTFYVRSLEVYRSSKHFI